MTNKEGLAILHTVQITLLASAQALDRLLLTKEHHMIDPTIAAVIAQIDTATNAVASRITDLIDKANANGSLSAAEVVAALQPEVDRLTALGKDPGNPVP